MNIEDIKPGLLFLLPLLDLQELLYDGRTYDALPATLDDGIQINVIMSNPPNHEILTIKEDCPIANRLTSNQYFKNRVDLIDQAFSIFTFEVPEEFEKDLYIYCTGDVSKLSEEFNEMLRNKLTEIDLSKKGEYILR